MTTAWDIRVSNAIAVPAGNVTAAGLKGLIFFSEKSDGRRPKGSDVLQ